MDDRGFDALTKLLALGRDRRGVLAALTALPAIGWGRLDSEAKKKKKKKKKATCKGTNSNCTSGSQCCAGLVCAVGSFQFEEGEECESVDGDVCCRTLGGSCTNLCDCCGSASICGDDDKCCVVHLGSCTQDSDCCGDEFCVDVAGGDDKTCRLDNNGADCDDDDDCLGGLFCVESEVLGFKCSCSTIGNPCDVDGDGDDECCPGSVCGPGDFCIAA